MCPVCFYDKMPDPPVDYNICPCCGTEFEHDDEVRTHEQLRDYWVSSGAKWFFREPPLFWNPWQQLVAAGVQLPYVATVTFAGTSTFGKVTAGGDEFIASVYPTTGEEVLGIAA
jgi:hypothetical protein